MRGAAKSCCKECGYRNSREFGPFLHFTPSSEVCSERTIQRVWPVSFEMLKIQSLAHDSLMEKNKINAIGRGREMTPEEESPTTLFVVTSSHVFCGTCINPSELH